MEDRPLVLWHGGCTDGFTAAWVLYDFFRRHHDTDIEAVEVHYQSNDPLPNAESRRVYIVDFSYPPGVLFDMAEKAESVVMLDHHKSALELWDPVENVPENTTVSFDMERSGAALTHDHLYGDGSVRPWLVDYVQDRDLWKWDLEVSREVNAFIQIQEKTFERWDRMLANGRGEARAGGRVVQSTIIHYVHDTAKKARLYEVAGHIVPVVNATYWNTSELLEMLSTTPLVDPVTDSKWTQAIDIKGIQPPFAISWYVRSDSKVSYSLRSRDYPDGREAFDVSALAKRFGGGGHRRAAGFAADKLIHTDALVVIEE